MKKSGDKKEVKRGRKRIKIGDVKGESFGYKHDLDLTVEIRLRDDEKGKVLSIIGNVWRPISPYPLALEGVNDVKKMLRKGDLAKLSIPSAPFFSLLEIWEKWHLNNLRPECEHQRKLIERLKANKGEDFFCRENYKEIINIPEFNRCPFCGFRYDSTPQSVQLPAEVINFVNRLIMKYGKEY